MIKINRPLVRGLALSSGIWSAAQLGFLPSVVGQQACPPSNNPSQFGQWGQVLDWRGNFSGSGHNAAVHLVVLPTGKVIMIPYGDTNDPRLWDPDCTATPTDNCVTDLPFPGYSIFCGGHSLVPDGRVLFSGGQLPGELSSLTEGEPRASYFNPSNNSWTSLPNMGGGGLNSGGRWYPTSTPLASGEVLVTSGFLQSGRGNINGLPEVWNSATGTWRPLIDAQAVVPPLYTRTFLAPDGRVFFAMGTPGGASSQFLNTALTGSWSTPVPSLRPNLIGHDNPSNPVAAACMDEAGTVYWFGGGEDYGGAVPFADCEKVNLAATTPPPAWTLITPMPQPRKFHIATILPDGKFLITGGRSTGEPADPNPFDEFGAPDPELGGGKPALLYDPNPASPTYNTWTELATECRYRGYHSTAVLLPDGRVLSTGGEVSHDANYVPTYDETSTTAQIFSPPYLFRGARPVIGSAPGVVGYGETFFVGTSEAAGITNVTWTRLSSTTHGFNWDQRINTLAFSQTPCGLNVTAPANQIICPPGYYMLWLINTNGVPSKSKMVRISPDSIAPTMVTVTATDASAREPESGSDNGAFTVARSGGNNSSALTVYYTVGGTATPASDYATLSGSVTIPANQSSAPINVNVLDDSSYEWNETVIVTLSTNPAYVIGGCGTDVVTIYSFLDLGVLPGGTGSRAYSISPSGSIAGGAVVNTNTRAFRSVAGQALTGADDLHPGLAQFFGGVPVASSSSVVYDQTAARFAGEFTYAGVTRAWVSDSCSPGYQQLTVPNSTQNYIRAIGDWTGTNTEGAGYSFVNGFNRFCQWYIYNCQPQYTYSYNIGSSLWPNNDSYALGIKWSKVVGFVALPAGRKGVIWDWNFSSSGPTYLNPQPGGIHTEAYDIDSYLSYTNIVGYSEASGLRTACFWTYNGYNGKGLSPTLLTKPAGWSHSIAQALNDQNRIVGNYYQASNPAETDRRACLWNSGSLVLLNSIVPVGSGWTLLTAEDINSQNHVVGTASNGTQIRGFRLKP